MSVKKNGTIFLLVIFSVLLLSGCGCKPTNPNKYKLSLEIWGTIDGTEALSEAFENYRKINPNITNITYKKIAAETYKNELLEGLASAQGPDIFLINNAWLPSFKNKVSEAPQVPGVNIINEQKFRNNFVDVAAVDFIDEGKIYAVPLTVDSLALYYNRDLFNQEGITEPPRTWEEFSEAVKKLRKLNAFNEVVQAGAAIGTYNNINRSTDILNMLMIQSGTEMVDSNGRVMFDSSVLLDGKNVSTGENSLEYYSQFSRSGSLYYTWNHNLHYSLDAFSEGNLAMMFNYSWHIKTIKEKSPKLNFGIAPVPQFVNRPKANYANYWALAVAKNKTPQSDPYGGTRAANVTNETRVGEAWLLLTYLTTKPDGSFFANASANSSVGRSIDLNFDPAKKYLEKTGEPAARRDLIEAQKADARIGVFAESNLVAKSWKRPDSDSVEGIFAEMIDDVYRGKVTVSEALRTGARRVQMLSNK